MSYVVRRRDEAGERRNGGMLLMGCSTMGRSALHGAGDARVGDELEIAIDGERTWSCEVRADGYAGNAQRREDRGISAIKHDGPRGEE